MTTLPMMVSMPLLLEAGLLEVEVELEEWAGHMGGGARRAGHITAVSPRPKDMMVRD